MPTNHNEQTKDMLGRRMYDGEQDGDDHTLTGINNGDGERDSDGGAATV